MLKNKSLLIIISFFLIALIFRFYKFYENIYFSFDQARDAYISQDIYQKGELKFIGPPISGNLGLFHGVLFWYLLGPLNIVFGGNPIIISVIFRIFNALGVFLVFGIGKRLFNSKIGLLSALFYATSFEQNQYSLYVSNPSLAVLSILMIFFGATLLLTDNKFTKWSPLLMFSGAAISTQFNIIYAYTFFIVLLILFIFKEKILKIPAKYYLFTALATLSILSTYLIVEIKYHFRSIKLTLILLQQHFGILNPSESKYLLYWKKYLIMFQDNILGLTNNNIIVGIIALLLTFWVFKKSLKNKKYSILLIWILGWMVLMFFGGHLAYYTNAGLSIGIIIAVSVFLEKIYKYNKFLAIFLILFIICGNIKKIKQQSTYSLIAEFTPQIMMKLSDEYKIIDQMYQHSNNQGFTIRVTGIPYKIQTVWAYLFHNYGEKKYNYLPYWENGNILGFPGTLPVPQNGTTCIRFRVVEPSRGIPQNLIDEDLKTENYFSDLINQENIGHFLLETRIAKDKNCHNNKP